MYPFQSRSPPLDSISQPRSTNQSNPNMSLVWVAPQPPPRPPQPSRSFVSGRPYQHPNYTPPSPINLPFIPHTQTSTNHMAQPMIQPFSFGNTRAAAHVPAQPPVQHPVQHPVQPPIQTPAQIVQPSTSTSQALVNPEPQVERPEPDGHQDEHRIQPGSNRVTREELDSLDLLRLQEKYRIYEKLLEVNKRSRTAIEKNLNDMTRAARGVNIEADPVFKKQKEEQRTCDKINDDLRDSMRKISDKLKEKFNHRIGFNHVPRPFNRVTQGRKRAKMSTTPITISNATNASSHDKQVSSIRDKKILLQLEDSNTWCQQCDIHFECLEEFCKHLHSRDHSLINRTKGVVPWRKPDTEKVDKAKTYDNIKSMIAKLGNETERFDIRAFDNVLNTASNMSYEDSKKRSLERERGNFDEDDPLFKIRGYNYLVPITGFYCTLCMQTLCDFHEVESHIKGYSHNLAHAKSVALNPEAETQYRVNFDRSYRKKYRPLEGAKSYLKAKEKNQNSNSSSGAPSNASSSTHTGAPPTIPVSTSSRPIPGPNVSKGATAPPAPYKKLTSSIVDNHDVVKSKFGDAPSAKGVPAPKVVQVEEAGEKSDTLEDNGGVVIEKDTSNKTSVNAPSVMAKIAMEASKIVPLGDARHLEQPALKRLRQKKVEVRKKKSVAVISSSSSSSTEDNDYSDSEEQIRESSGERAYEVEENGEVHLPMGDFESPYPQYELSVTANIHLECLKDKRLAQECKVRMTRINLNDYQLMDKETVWSRINALMAKKEEKRLSKGIRDKSRTQATFFGSDGTSMPIEITARDKSDKYKGENETNNDNRDTTRTDSAGDKTKNPTDCRDPESNTEGGDEEGLDMSFLETFFVQK